MSAFLVVAVDGAESACVPFDVPDDASDDQIRELAELRVAGLVDWWWERDPERQSL